MSKRPSRPQAGPKELMNGVLTLLEWQRQLVLEVLADLPDETARTHCPTRPGSRPPGRGCSSSDRMS